MISNKTQLLDENLIPVLMGEETFTTHARKVLQRAVNIGGNEAALSEFIKFSHFTPTK